MNQSVLTNENRKEMSNLFQIDPKYQKAQYENDLSVMQNTKLDMTSGLYLSNLQKERSDQIDLVMSQRRYLFKQEQALLTDIEELKKTHQRYRDSRQHYGIANANLEATMKDQLTKLEHEMNQIQQQKEQVRVNFDKIQQNLVNSKAKLQNTGLLVLQSNGQYQHYVDKINQQSKLISSMKEEFNDPKNNEFIPMDKKLEELSEQTFEKQARLLYNGTKFEGSEQQKVAALSTLRRKIEEHTKARGLNGVILEMPFNIENNYVHRNEYQETMQYLNELKQEYITSGGTDPNYLIEINTLENYYKMNHPSGGIAKPDKLHMNLEERGPITQNPIFQYLPKGFQKEIYELENQQKMQQEAMLQHPTRMRPPVDIKDSSQADENMLEYLRQQEAEIMLTMHKSDLNRDKYQEIQKMKALYEKRYLEKRVQEELSLKQMEDDILNKRARPQDKVTYLKFIQGEINTMPSFYDPDNGFIIRFDYLTSIPVCYDYIKLYYGFYTDQNPPLDPIAGIPTGVHQTFPDGLSANKCIMLERFISRDLIVYDRVFIYMTLQGYSNEFGGAMVPIDIGWSLHKLFNESLITGYFELPFYNGHFGVDVHKMPEVDQIRLGMRICLPGDAVLDLDNKLINVQQYNQQEIHKKDLDLIRQEQQFKFREHRIIDLPSEFIETRVNSTVLCNSQVPPNQFTLQSLAFITDAQAMQKKQEEEYQARQNQRYVSKRRNLRSDTKTSAQGTPAESVARKRRLQTRIDLSKAGTGGQTNRNATTNRNGTNKNDPSTNRSSRAKAGQTTVRSRRPQSSVGDKDKVSDKSADVEHHLVFKLRALNQIYTAHIETLKMKLAIFCGNKLVEDDERRPCMIGLDLKQDEKGPNFFKYSLSEQFTLNVTEFINEEDQEDVLNTYLYIAIFKENDTLIGWQAIQIFELLDERIKIRSGIYFENIFAGPGQSPPFELNRVRKLNVQINFIMMQDDDRIIQLQQFDNYQLDKKLKTEEDENLKKKVYSLQNPKWNSQIKIDISSLLNFPSKTDFIVKAAVYMEDEIITDIIDRLCILIDSVELFEGQAKHQFIANHTLILRIGSRYLHDIYPTVYKKLLYQFVFYNEQKIIGAFQYPLFTSQGTLVTGVLKLNVHDFDGAKLGKKTNKEITIYIQEEPINLKDVEVTPTYAKQTKTQKNIAQLDKSKYLIVDLEEITDYPGKGPVDEIIIQIYKGTEIAVDIDGKLCTESLSNNNAPISNKITLREQVTFRLPINQLIEGKTFLDQYEMYIFFPNLGWLMKKLFIGGQLNTEESIDKLFGGPPVSPPVDYITLKKINAKLQCQMRYDVKPQSIDQIGIEDAIKLTQQSQNSIRIDTNQNQSMNLIASNIQSRRVISVASKNEEKNSITIVFVNINGFKENVDYFIKVVLMSDRKPLKDKNNQNCARTTAKYFNSNKTVYMVNEKQVFEVEVKKLSDEVTLFLQVHTDVGLQGWYYKNIMKQAGKLAIGKYFEKLFKPPQLKPPIDPNKCIELPQTFQIEIQ